MEIPFKIPLCSHCFNHFFNSKHEPNHNFTSQNGAAIQDYAYNLEHPTNNNVISVPLPCSCCLNILTDEFVSSSANMITNLLHSHDRNKTIKLEITNPISIIELLRITTKTILSHLVGRTLSFPPIHEVLERCLIKKLADWKILPMREKQNPELQISIYFSNSYDHDLWLHLQKAVAPDNETCQQPRKRIKSDNLVDDGQRQFHVDQLAILYKSLNETSIKALRSTLCTFLTKHGSTIDLGLSYEIILCPIYIYGRYMKYARDVPQSPWTINSDHNDDSKPSSNISNDVTATQFGQSNRKGRLSVEEIVSFTIKKVLGASGCKMHPCGREDIDVRCLGNGRPFALEVSNPTFDASPVKLQEVMDSINHCLDLNVNEDIGLAQMRKVGKEVWSSMQEKAEEKKKGYSCVIWSSDVVTAESLKKMTDLCNNGPEKHELGENCLEIVQFTPIRVMHRRSLLNRKRFIYNMRTTLLNPHYFLLDLITSAGTYVKEFVHGDLGRTTPSVASLLHSKTNILQLDVTRLYDDFDSGTYRSEGRNSSSDEIQTSTNTISIIADLKLPRFHS